MNRALLLLCSLTVFSCAFGDDDLDLKDWAAYVDEPIQYEEVENPHEDKVFRIISFDAGSMTFRLSGGLTVILAHCIRPSAAELDHMRALAVQNGMDSLKADVSIDGFNGYSSWVQGRSVKITAMMQVQDSAFRYAELEVLPQGTGTQTADMASVFVENLHAFPRGPKHRRLFENLISTGMASHIYEVFAFANKGLVYRNTIIYPVGVRLRTRTVDALFNEIEPFFVEYFRENTTTAKKALLRRQFQEVFSGSRITGTGKVVDVTETSFRVRASVYKRDEVPERSYIIKLNTPNKMIFTEMRTQSNKRERFKSLSVSGWKSQADFKISLIVGKGDPALELVKGDTIAFAGNIAVTNYASIERMEIPVALRDCQIKQVPER